MRRLLPVLALLLAGAAQAAPAITSGPTGGSAHATTNNLALTSVAASAGDLLLVFMGWGGNGDPGTFSIADSGGSGSFGAWSSPVALQNTGDPIHVQTMFFWAVASTAVAGKTATVTWSNTVATDADAFWLTVSGANNAAPVGGSSTAFNNNGSTALLNITTTGTGSLVLMGVGDWTANALGGVNGTSTSLITQGTVGTSQAGLQRITALVDAGAQAMSRTLGGADVYTASAVEILAGAEAGASPPVRLPFGPARRGWRVVP
jgi:hypothetical protein